MIPPGNRNTKTFVCIPAMMVNMKLVQIREYPCRPFPVQKEMHKCIHSKARKPSVKKRKIVVKKNAAQRKNSSAHNQKHPVNMPDDHMRRLLVVMIMI